MHIIDKNGEDRSINGCLNSIKQERYEYYYDQYLWIRALAELLIVFLSTWPEISQASHSKNVSSELKLGASLIKLDYTVLCNRFCNVLILVVSFPMRNLTCFINT